MIEDTAMASSSLVAPIRRSLAFTALLGAFVTAGPLAPARAETPAQPSAPHAETVEQRIAGPHTALKITPEEEPAWQAVAQAIRDNAATLQKLAADKAAQMRQDVTAVEDLQTYLQFAQAHVDGLKNLIAAFQTLYASMPDQQKKLADGVFRTYRQRHGARLG
jgi:protein CpxP